MILSSFFVQQLPADATSTDHGHPFGELVLVTGAEGWVEISGKKHPHPDPAVVFHPPETRHRHFTAAPSTHYCLGVSGRDLKKIPFAVLPAGDRLIHSFRSMAIEMEERGPFHRPLMEALGSEIVWRLLRGLSKTQTPESKPANLAQAMKHYLDERHHESGLTLKAVSQKLMLDKDSIRHLFKKTYGVSPIRYLIEKKIAHAKTLLTSGKDPLRVIAQETGFENEFYFSRVFKNETGMTANQYRRAGGRQKPAPT